VLGGQRLYFVGGVKNEGRQAALAVFGPEGPRGVAPAEDPYYACQDCGTGYPMAAFAFPRTEVGRISGSFPVVESVAIRGDEVWVSVRQNTGHERYGSLSFLLAPVTYHLDTRLRLLEASYEVEYEVVHHRLESAGLVHHPFDGVRQQRELWPVGRWDGARWLPIPGPEVPSR
jgi:hypothetical protein